VERKKRIEKIIKIKNWNWKWLFWSEKKLILIMLMNDNNVMERYPSIKKNGHNQCLLKPYFSYVCISNNFRIN